MLKIINIVVGIDNVKIFQIYLLVLTKFTSVIGRNGAGKTTLIKIYNENIETRLWQYRIL